MFISRVVSIVCVFMLMLALCNDESRVAGLCVSALSDAGGNYCYYTMIDAMIYKLSDNRSPQL